MPLTIVFFCPQKSQHASRPGSAVNNAQLVAVMPGHVGEKDVAPNKDIFANSNGSAQVSFNGLTDQSMAELESGKRYEVTFKEVP